MTTSNGRRQGRVRLVTGVVTMAVMVTAVTVGSYLLAVVLGALGCIAILEYASMVRLRGVHLHRGAMVAATLLLLVSSFPTGHDLRLASPLPLPTLAEAWIGVLLVVFILAVRRPHEKAVAEVGAQLLGLAWIPTMLGTAFVLREMPDAQVGLGALMHAGLAIVAADVGAYYAGKRFGSTPLAPILSPDKTVEGAVGGLVLAGFVVTGATLLPLASLATALPTVYALPFALLVAGASQLGDLFESLVKRWAGVKDAGLFLPGQGGVLDRIDSHLLGIPVAFLVMSSVHGL